MLSKLFAITAFVAIIYATLSSNSLDNHNENVEASSLSYSNSESNNKVNEDTYKSQIFFEVNYSNDEKNAYISYELVKNSKVELDVLNEDAKAIHNINLGHIKAGLNGYKLDFNSYKKGTYFLLFKANNIVRYHKIVIR